MGSKSDEVIRLANAVTNFSTHMMAKLTKQVYAGYSGWDNSAYRYHILDKLERHLERLKNGEPQEVDIANLAMFLRHQRRHNRK